MASGFVVYMEGKGDCGKSGWCLGKWVDFLSVKLFLDRQSDGGCVEWLQSEDGCVEWLHSQMVNVLSG